MNATLATAPARQERTAGQTSGPWWRSKRQLSVLLLLAALFTGAFQTVPALQNHAGAAVSGNLNGTTSPPSGFNTAINYWSSQGWPVSASNRTHTRILCEWDGVHNYCVNHRQFIDGGGRYNDRDGQLRRYLLNGYSGPQVCSQHGSTVCTGRPASSWIGNFHEYDVNWRHTRGAARDAMRIVRVHGGPNDGDTFVTTDHYRNFTFIGSRH
ncbi:ribonuclease domain-containing protein [Streptomyces sp. NPDC005760]|uniref:ribonuclease domain-containing protein n=1 Tax=Streptomyces sp. NPDC005760 TaxID=3156718 RepID=UPI003406C6B4